MNDKAQAFETLLNELSAALAHAHAAENVTLSTTGSASLVAQDAGHAHTSEAIALTADSTLAVASASHAHTADNVTLSDAPALTVQDADHAHAADAPVLTLESWLAVADSWHVHTASNVVLAFDVDELSLILKILRNRQELNPSTGKFTLYDDDGTTVLMESNAWADADGTIPYSGGILARLDALT